MRLYSLILGCAMFLSSINGISHAQEREFLKRDDVNKVMKEILAQHLGEKAMTANKLKGSYKLFLEQFDVERTYLLANEVNQLLQINDAKMNQLLKQYTNNDLEEYQAINDTIQKSILRARNIRQELYKNKDLLFQQSTLDLAKSDEFLEDKKPPFAANTDELKKRIKDQILQLISTEKKRYGAESILSNQDKILNANEQFFRHKENQYLYTNEEGDPLSKQDQENLFVLHVLKSLARSLDAHTSFLDPSEAHDMQIRLEKGFQGVGIILEKKPHGIAITKLIKNSPAERSGQVQINDRIVSINGQNVENYSLEDLIEKLREKGDSIQLTLKRPANDGEAQIPVTLKREEIIVDDDRVNSVAIPYGDGIVGILTLNTFYQGEKGVTSEKDIRQAIQDLSKEGHIKGLILDLRENSGGFLTQAVKVAGLFITNGVIVVSKYNDGKEKFYRDVDGKVSFDGPLIILTSKATASAAEIVAQALQDYGVAVVVGDKHTYGKGTIQSQTVTDDGSTSYFKVTVGKYYTVSGKTPQRGGVLADIVVPSRYSNDKIGEEYLDGALEPDKIRASYTDNLQDVDPNLRGWYLHYYTPSLQKKETTWAKLIPLLKKNSERRQMGTVSAKNSLSQSPELSKDPQLAEAVNILEDMIRLDKSHPPQRATVFTP